MASHSLAALFYSLSFRAKHAHGNRKRVQNAHDEERPTNGLALLGLQFICEQQASTETYCASELQPRSTSSGKVMDKRFSAIIFTLLSSHPA